MLPAFSLVGEAGDGAQGLALCRRLKPDVALLDIQMPGLDGIELAATLMAEPPAPRILLLTSRKDALTINRAAELGIPGYVEKDVELKVLEAALTRVAAGERFYCDHAAETVGNLARDETAFSKMLSRREQEILALVGQGLTSKTIAARLALSPRTVESHRHNIMQKLGIKDLAGLIRYAVTPPGS
jgi:DNA-binding NarL/FixJ family response regulator